MVRIVVNDDLVGIPYPSVAIAYIKRRYAPKPSVKPEPPWTASAQMPNVAATNSAIEATVLPGMVEMIIGVRTTGVMTHPLAAIVNVRRFGVTLSVGMAGLRSGPAFSAGWSGSFLRNKSSSYPVSTTAAAMLLTALGGHERRCRHCQTYDCQGLENPFILGFVHFGYLTSDDYGAA
jgi:hypothetical protein